MLLNGWKDIATYLGSDIRTVRRWAALGLPVIRVTPGDRGPVVARTEMLDAWLTARNQKNRGRIHPDLLATFERAASLCATAADERRAPSTKRTQTWAGDIGIGISDERRH